VKTLMILFASALLLAGCTSSKDSSATQSNKNSTVTIQGIAFSPAKLTVPVGAKVIWTNKDNVKHTVTSGKPGKDAVPGVSKGSAAKPTGVFDQPMSPSGSTFSFTFSKSGTFTYFCRIHSSMRGTIVVR
jgi:plastocyanin